MYLRAFTAYAVHSCSLDVSLTINSGPCTTTTIVLSFCTTMRQGKEKEDFWRWMQSKEIFCSACCEKIIMLHHFPRWRFWSIGDAKRSPSCPPGFQVPPCSQSSESGVALPQLRREHVPGATSQHPARGCSATHLHAPAPQQAHDRAWYLPRWTWKRGRGRELLWAEPLHTLLATGNMA